MQLLLLAPLNSGGGEAALASACAELLAYAATLCDVSTGKASECTPLIARATCAMHRGPARLSLDNIMPLRGDLAEATGGVRC